MEIIRGPKPFTEAERAFAGEKAALVKREVDAFADCPSRPAPKLVNVLCGDEELPKQCGTCGVVKTRGDFHCNRVAKDGRSFSCRPCRKEYARNYYNRLYGPKYAAQPTLSPSDQAAIDETRRIHSEKRRNKYFQPGRE